MTERDPGERYELRCPLCEASGSAIQTRSLLRTETGLVLRLRCLVCGEQFYSDDAGSVRLSEGELR